MSVAREALDVLRRNGLTQLWYGDEALIGEIAARARIKARHHAARSATVLGTCAKSPLFEPAGTIEHLGQRYPVFRIRGSAKP